MTIDEKTVTLVQNALEEIKGVDILQLDVSDLTDVTETMMICTATSNQHAKALANKVVTELKQANEPPLGVEGEEHAQWILIDADSVVCHIMQKDVREFYALEKLWSKPAILATGS